MIQVKPSHLYWANGDDAEKTLTFTNDGPEDLWLTIDAAPVVQDNRYFWGPVKDVLITAKRQAGAAQSVILVVSPPLNTFDTLTADVKYTYRNSAGHYLPGGTVECRNDAPPENVQPPKVGDLWLVGLVYDPPGTDVGAQGEYIDIQNRARRHIKLDGCALRNKEYFSGSNHGVERVFHTLKGELPPNGTMRIYNGSGASGDPLILYLNRGKPIWNNGGDIVSMTLNSAANSPRLFTYGYGSESNVISEYTDLVPTELPALPIFELSVRVGAAAAVGGAWQVSRIDIQDGDRIVVETQEGALRDAYSLKKLQPGVGVIKNDYLTSAWYLPSGCGLNDGIIHPATPAPMDYPCSGAAQFGLIMGLKLEGASGIIFQDTKFIGSGFEEAMTLEEPVKLSLSFGINDSVLYDNAGYFDIVVKVFRR